MATVDQAVAALLDPTTPSEVKTQAFAYISAVKKEAGFFEYAMRKSVELDVTVAQNLHVAFFYLQAIEELVNEEYAKYTETQRSQVHQYLAFILSPDCPLLQSHPSLLSKLAVIYVKVVALDFPELWPLAFSQLIQAATSIPAKKFFLTVMKIANEDLLDTREDVVLPLAKRLKEEMRKRVLGDAATAWRRFLTEPDPDIVTMSLTVFAAYIDWMPLDLALEFLPDIQRLLPHATTACLHCLTSLVQKGMDPGKKLELINRLNVLQFVEALTGGEVATAAASLVNAIGMQIMECGDSPLLQPTVSLSLRFLSSPGFSASQIVLDFLTEYIHALKVKSLALPATSLSDTEKSHISAICLSVMRKCERPERLEVEGEEEFEGYRKELGQVFKNLVGVAGVLESVIELIGKNAQDICSSLSQANPATVEVLLFLLYQLAECIPDIHKRLASDSSISRLIEYILASGIKDLPHKQVIRQYLELCIRYSSYFEQPSRACYLPSVLSPLVTHTASRDPAICTHAIYMLYRLVLKMPQTVATHALILLEHVATLFTRQFDEDSSMYVSKAFGLLLANKSLPPTSQKSVLQSFLQTLRSPFSLLQLRLMGDFVGGFQRVAPIELHEELRALGEWVGTEMGDELDLARYQAVVYFYQKLMVALEDDISDLLGPVLQKLYSKASLETLEELLKVTLIQLIAHTMQVVKSRLEVALPPEVILGIVIGVITTVPCPTTAISAEALQLISLRKTWVKLLDQMVGKGLDLFAVCEGMRVVEYLVALCENKNEVGVRLTQSIKGALTLLHRLLSSSSNCPSLPIFLSLCLRLTKSLTSLGLNPKTAEAAYIIQELVLLHLEMLRIGQSLGQEEDLSQALLALLPIAYLRSLQEAASQSTPRAECLPRLRGLLLAALPA